MPISTGKKTRHSHSSEREVAALQPTNENSVEVQQIKQALLLWSGFMLETSPGFVGRLYAALTYEWRKHVRDVIYESLR